MPHRDRAALKSLIVELNRVWRIAGPLSFQDFEELSKSVEGPAGSSEIMRHSTTHNILAGNLEGPPKWRWVVRFLTVLRAAAEQAGADPASIGTLAEWKERYEAACASIAAVPDLAQAAGGEDAVLPDPVRHSTRSRRRTTGLLLNERDIRHDPELAALLRAAGSDWWRDYSDLVPAWLGTYLSLEPAASLIRAYEPTLIPGWLQTEDYAAEAIRLSLLSPGPATVTRLVELRMHQQEFLKQPGAARLWVIIEEDAVRQKLGSTQTMRAQLEHLIGLSQLPSMTVQVIPSGTAALLVPSGPITFLRFRDPDWPDVVYLRQPAGIMYLPGQRGVSHSRKALSRLGIKALKPAVTTDFLRGILTDI